MLIEEEERGLCMTSRTVIRDVNRGGRGEVV
jgi:hypothetical protein